MTIAVKRILLVTRDVQFAINVKRALESLGEYAVTPVTEARNAIEQLRRKPHHLALLDIENLAIAPAVMIDLIRARQGEIAIVLGPDNPAARELAQEFRVQGLVDIPVSSRILIPILEGSLRDVYEALPQTARLPAIELQEDTVNIESLVDGLLLDQALPSYSLQKLQASYRLLHPSDDDETADSAPAGLELAIETDDESGTIRYWHINQLNGDDQARAKAGIQDEDTPISSPDGQTTVSELGLALADPNLDWSKFASTAPEAQRVKADNLDRFLREAWDENTNIESLAEFALGGKIGGPASDSASPPRNQRRGFAADTLPSLGAPPYMDHSALPAESTLGAELATTAAARSFSATVTSRAKDKLPAPLYGRVDDPYVRQVAAVMTQTMTELTAEATLLTRDNAVVAYSGGLQPDDLSALRKAINDDWTVEQGRARLRFVTLPDGHRRFMLYSKATLDDMTLSLVFAGSQSLRAINRQGDRMMQAMMQAMAQVPLVDEETAQDESVTYPALSAADAPDTAAQLTQTLTFVWLAADPATALSQTVAEQLVFWLELQLNNLGWTARRIDVHQDFVYLIADIPKGAPPDQTAKDLMARSQRIARAEDPTLPPELWADAYLILQPGRDLDMRELQGFLRFVRADA